MSFKPRIAFVLDALPAVGGGEKTLFAALEVFPQADIFALIYNKVAFAGTPIANKKIITSILDRLPLANSHYRLFLPLMPTAIERFDFYPYDIVVAFSYAVAHGVRVKGPARHLCYMYTPMRYAWSAVNLDGTRSPKTMALSLAMQRFREWDRSAAARVQGFAAISHEVVKRIRSAYQQEARVIYPPVEVDRFSVHRSRQEYFVTLSRLVPHKRIDIIIEAFSRLRLPLKIIGDGPQRRKLQRQATPNIEFLGFQSEEAVTELLGKARAFVCAAEEDFGIAIVEAQAAGCPVIVYGGGGALETVIEGETGLFFPEQSVESVIQAVRQFEETAQCFRAEAIVENAQRFGKGRFQKAFQEFVGEEDGGSS